MIFATAQVSHGRSGATSGVASQREPVPALIKGHLGSSVRARDEGCLRHLFGRASRSSAPAQSPLRDKTQAAKKSAPSASRTAGRDR